MAALPVTPAAGQWVPLVPMCGRPNIVYAIHPTDPGTNPPAVAIQSSAPSHKLTTTIHASNDAAEVLAFLDDLLSHSAAATEPMRVGRSEHNDAVAEPD